MSEPPFWMLSPSPYSITVWSLLAYYGAKHMNPHTLKQWAYSLTTCAFVVGLVVMPFDSLWIIFQVIKFGYLHPEEILPTLTRSLGRNLLMFSLCYHETGEIRPFLNRKAFINILWFVPVFIAWFGLAPDPSWTDWTYAFRFGYSNLRVVQAFIISHIFMKAMQSIIYIKLWK